MAERPLLSLPRPTRGPLGGGRFQNENIHRISYTRQSVRLGPKFDRLERVLSEPARLGELQSDPDSIAPERALVFEVASNLADFYRAIRAIPSLEFVGEDETDAPADDDFYILEKGERNPEKRVPRRVYFTIPDQVALRELLSLWNRFVNNQALGTGRASWRTVFEHLVDLRPWGPQDRLTPDAIADWRDRLQYAPETPVRFKVEFWFRNNAILRARAEQTFREEVDRLGGQVLDRAEIGPIRYHAALAEVRPEVIRDLLDHPDIGLATFDDIMVLRPQSMVTAPVEVDLETTEPEALPQGEPEGLGPPVAALFDGLPMGQHTLLRDRLTIDDPDDFASFYGRAADQIHGTGMASLILHGDLHSPTRGQSIPRRLYVRPVTYPQQMGLGRIQEIMPPGRLGVDLMWRAFRRMLEGEGSEPAAAPTVRIVNLSLGDAKRRFTGAISPWGRLIDYLAWQYGLLILVSAGNITDPLPLPDTQSWSDIENAPLQERQLPVLRSILQQRASRTLLSPAEAINALTIGAMHTDYIAPNGTGVMAIDPYAISFLPNPSSALGLGFRRAVKPDLLMPGGREQLQSRSNQAPIDVCPVAQPGSYFGIGVASPSVAGDTNRKVNMSGTSVANALATHSALQILQALDELPSGSGHPEIDPRYHAVILKALLVHSARWDRAAVAILKPLVNNARQLPWQHEREEITRFLGYGWPDITRVLDCAENRATLIGGDHIRAREANCYRVPLPPDLEGARGFRAVSITLAWLTPVTLSHRMYRMTKLEAGPASNKGFSLGVEASQQQPSPDMTARGTIFHRRWEGEKAAVFVDDGYLVLNVTCRPTAGELDDAIPYGLAVTLEVGAEVSVPIYEIMIDRLRQAIPVRT